MRPTVSRARRRGGASGGGVTPFFEETFTGNQFNPYGGFAYSTYLGGNSASVVTFDGYTCARLRYAAKAPGENDSAQMNFDMGRYLNAVWFEFLLHVPSNFEMRPPTLGNKLWQVYRDTYSGAPANGTQQFGMEYWIIGGVARPEATGRAMLRSIPSMGFNAITDIPTDANNQTPLIGGSGPIAVGGWTRIRAAVKGSSAFGVSDGFYKVWAGNTLYTDVSAYPLHNYEASPADVLFRNGYLMGFSNTGFTSQTDFHLRGIKFYDTNPGW